MKFPNQENTQRKASKHKESAVVIPFKRSLRSSGTTRVPEICEEKAIQRLLDKASKLDW
ncbi:MULTISPECIES: hypothetical protein [unclassified Pseudoalteromonas]|uniref:hypothetical protein n=1 Tax=unclassified Pseudoalteromonas TaxID=194690 RepID=UPI001F17C834|nr:MULTISPECIES: hypothetical protein [unclassified Pseudoalteromonas]MCF2828666.1 hypothetical protein [Pseudoalteromonas sp. OF5H-5]MCF2831841.1 hypothetical protein [Pseudoalteromonas sp. DL2-H6]MCF2925162.1 hypothetical protein [Pseudoalteromonas sp. DL2-H1]